MDAVLDRTVNEWPFDHDTSPGFDQLWDIAQVYLGEPRISSYHHHHHYQRQMDRVMPWRFHYIDEDHLRQLTNRPRDLEAAVESELDKVNDFYLLKRGEIERRIERCDLTKKDVKRKKGTLATRGKELEQISREILLLYRFVKFNYRALVSVALIAPSLPVVRLLRDKAFYTPPVFYDFAMHISRVAETIPTATSSEPSCVSRTGSLPFSASQRLQDENQYPLKICVDTMYDGGDQNHHEDVSSEVREDQQTVYEDSAERLSSSPASIASSATFMTTLSSLSQISTTSEQKEFTEPMPIVQKYLVHPDHLMAVLLDISRHTHAQSNDRLGSYGGENNSYAHSNLGSHNDNYDQSTRFDHAVWESQFSHGVEAYPTSSPFGNTIHTTYMDTSDLTGYRDHLRHRRASTLRIRTYGKYCAVEKKVYRYDKPCAFEGMGVRRASTKQRVWIKPKKVKPWIQGQWSLSQLLSKSPPTENHCQHSMSTIAIDNLASDVIHLETETRTRHLTPVLKAALRRSVFKDRHGTVLCLDSDIVMARPHVDIDNGIYPYFNVPTNDIVRFPCAVLQVILPPSGCPNWLKDHLSSGIVERVNRFSVYLHGVSSLMCDQKQTIPSLHIQLNGLGIKHSNSVLSCLLSSGASQSSDSSDLGCSKYSSSTRATTPVCNRSDEEEKSEKTPLRKSRDANSSSYSSTDASSPTDSVGTTWSIPTSIQGTPSPSSGKGPGTCPHVTIQMENNNILEDITSSSRSSFSLAAKTTIACAFASLGTSYLLYHILVLL